VRRNRKGRITSHPPALKGYAFKNLFNGGRRDTTPRGRERVNNLTLTGVAQKVLEAELMRVGRVWEDLELL
jgi:hypothetical protein